MSRRHSTSTGSSIEIAVERSGALTQTDTAALSDQTGVVVTHSASDERYIRSISADIEVARLSGENDQLRASTSQLTARLHQATQRHRSELEIMRAECAEQVAAAEARCQRLLTAAQAATASETDAREQLAMLQARLVDERKSRAEAESRILAQTVQQTKSLTANSSARFSSRVSFADQYRKHLSDQPIPKSSHIAEESAEIVLEALPDEGAGPPVEQPSLQIDDQQQVATSPKSAQASDEVDFPSLGEPSRSIDSSMADKSVSASRPPSLPRPQSQAEGSGPTAQPPPGGVSAGVNKSRSESPKPPPGDAGGMMSQRPPPGGRAKPPPGGVSAGVSKSRSESPKPPPGGSGGEHIARPSS